MIYLQQFAECYLIKNNEDLIVVKENMSPVKRFYPFVAFYKYWTGGHQDLGDKVELSDI